MRLTDLSRYNSWWKLGRDFCRFDYDLRSIEYFIERHRYDFSIGNIYIIRGPRRSGKSVYIKLYISNLLSEGIEPRCILYLPCDRLSSRKELSQILRNFIRFNDDSKRIYIFLDEVTYLPEWFLVLKDLAEMEVSSKICVVATGSSPVSLKESSERLPGRRVEGNELWLMPLSFREFILNVPDRVLPIPKEKINKLKKTLIKIEFSFEEPNPNQLSGLYVWHEELEKLFDIYLRTGGMPELIMEYLRNRKISEKNLEMLIRFVLGEISKAKKSEIIALGILRYLTDNLTQRVDYKKIANNIDAHHATVRDIIETLQKALILFQINHVDINTKKFSERKQKKFVFTDVALVTALKSYIYGLSWDELIWEIERIKPNLIENLVISTAITSIHEPYRKEWWTRIGYFYTEKYEIDLVVLSKTKIQTYEVKYTEKTRTTRAKITITKDEIDIEKSKIPSIYILATTPKSPKTI
ncbi:MAG: ATP-binding protein [Candidatus Njordarchaeota archaeon]